MPSNVRTLTTTYSRQSDTPEVATSLAADLREAARTRLANQEYRLPFLNDFGISDFRVIETLNSTLRAEDIRNILTDIVNNTRNYGTVRMIIDNLPPNISTHIIEMSNSPVHTRTNYTEFLNLLMYANVGIGDLNAAAETIFGIINNIELNGPIALTEEVSEANRSISENTRASNNNADDIGRAANLSRNNIFARMNWNTIMWRGGITVASMASLYFSGPYWAPILRAIGSGALNAATSSSPLDIGRELAIGARSEPRQPNIGDAANSFSEAFRTLFEVIFGRR